MYYHTKQLPVVTVNVQCDNVSMKTQHHVAIIKKNQFQIFPIFYQNELLVKMLYSL